MVVAPEVTETASSANLNGLKLSTCTQNLTATIHEQKLAIHEQKLAVSEQRLAVGRHKLLVSEEKLAVCEQRLAVFEQRLAISEEKLAVSEAKLAVGEAKLAFSEAKFALREEELVASTQKPSISDEKPIVNGQSIMNGQQPTQTVERPIDHVPRVYHNFPGAQYTLPADERERERLSLQHHLFKDLDRGKLILAPYTVQSGDHVLDSGTGSGIWLTDLQPTIPSDVKLYGVDIESRLFPAPPPENTFFTRGSVLQLPGEWTDKFNFAHQRLLIAGLREEEWHVAIAELQRVLSPGSWVQLSEASRTTGSSVTARFQELKGRLFEKRGLIPNCAARIPEMLREAGFSDVQIVRKDIPVGVWAGDIGVRARKNFMGVYRGMKTPVLKSGGFGFVASEAEFDKLLNDMEEEWNTTEGSTVEFLSFIARK